MKTIVLSVLAALSFLTIAANAFAQSNLTVVRHTDNTLWSQVCSGADQTTCTPWTAMTGRFTSQPALTWDASIAKYIVIGNGVTGGKVWKATFNADGTFNQDWVEVTGSASASPVALAAFAGIQVYDAAGQDLGKFVNDESGCIGTFLPSLTKMIVTDMSNGTLRNFHKPSGTYFTTADCSGLEFQLPDLYVFQRDGKYYSGANTTPEWITVRSWSDGTVCRATTYDMPAVQVVELSLPITFPVTLPLKFR
jgi:hypothetical protein